MIILLETENFTLVKKNGINLDGIPYEELEVIPENLANEFNIAIDLESNTWLKDHSNEELIVYKYYDIIVRPRAINKRLTNDDIDKYISILKESVAFTEKVKEFLVENNLYVGK